MKKIVFLLLFVATTTFGQIRFEKGYFITMDDERKECLIKNVDWKNNPTEISYQLENSQEEQIATVQNTKEFGIYGTVTYVRADVQIDRSPVDLKKLSLEKNPQWSSETLFLKQMVKGKANLYSYRQANTLRFFYSVDGGAISQLVQKKYYTYIGQNREVVDNNAFRQQLWNDVRCGETTLKKIENVSYNHSELNDYFVGYNQCNGEVPTDVTEKKQRTAFVAKLAPGVTSATFALSNSGMNEYVDFGRQMNLRFGFELEYILPFNNNKWSVTFEPVYETYSEEKVVIRYNSDRPVSIDYKTIDFHIGGRYYMYFSKDFSGFLNASYVPGFSRTMDSKIRYNQTEWDVTQKAYFNFGGGFGYKRFTAEFRLASRNDLLNDRLAWGGEYSKFSFIIGYKFLEIKTRK